MENRTRKIIWIDVKRASLILFFFVCCSCSITEDNDFIGAWTKPGGIDSAYTQGLVFSGTTKNEKAREFANHLPEFAGTRDSKTLPDQVTFSFGQKLYTPDSKSPEPQYNDRPYAAVLFGEMKRRNLYEDGKIETGLTTGIVGPWALGEQIQNGFHDLINNKHFEGWDNQVQNEPILMLEHKREKEDFRWFEKYQLVGFSGIDGRVGNLHTDISPYTEVRYGYNVPKYIEETKPHFRAYTYGKLRSSLVAYDLTMQGNTYRDNEVTVTPEIATAQANAGVALEIYHVGIRFSYTYITKEFTVQEQPNHLWGSIAIYAGF